MYRFWTFWSHGAAKTVAAKKRIITGVFILWSNPRLEQIKYFLCFLNVSMLSLDSVARENFEITPPNLPKIAKFHATAVYVENSHFFLKLGPK